MLADNLKNLRRKRGFSEAKLAKKLFVSRELISAWERGRAMPSIIDIKRLAEILDATPYDLLKDRSNCNDI